MSRLRGKVALITGGNRGIGLATARLFIAEGAHVVITGRDQRALDHAAAELGANVIALRADVTDTDSCTAIIAHTVDRFGTLDVVFANAGIAAPTPLGTTGSSDFESILRTNVTAAFLTVQAAIPHLRRGASVILNGSVYAVLGPPGFSAYAASKGALRSMSRVLAAELAPRGIRVNIVVPGETRTDIWKVIAPTEEAFTALDAQLSRSIPLGRMCEPDDIAKGVLYLASDDSASVTAAEIVIDGGHTGAPNGAPLYANLSA